MTPEFISSQKGITDDFLNTVPAHPGVYIMKNASGKVLYVGKSRNLKLRVRSYYRKSGDTRNSIQFIRRNVTTIEFCLTDTEKEALILENNLIKKFTPRYNIRLRDDKSFYHIRVNIQEDYPALELVRRPKEDGALYFGPYSSSHKLKETIRYLYLLYPLRTCKMSTFKNRTRPCLMCQIRKCLGPCCGKVSREDYHAMLEDVIMILRGQKSQVLENLKKKMDAASQSLDFEQAALVRDRIYAIEHSLEKQDVVSVKRVNKDVFGVHYHAEWISFNILQVREGRLEGTENFVFRHNDLPADEILASFIQQFYARRPIPDTVLVPCVSEDFSVIEEWLCETAGKKVYFSVPQRGDNLRLLKMAEKNACQIISAKKNQESDLLLLKKRFNLQNVPHRIECFDISTLQGESSVGSNVVFIDCQPKKNLYRRYSIKTVEGQNDFAMMGEVLGRRLDRAIEEKEYPDLCIIDGGKGQLSSAWSCYQKRKDTLPHIDFIALAKDHDMGTTHSGERVFLPDRKNPVVLENRSEEKKILDRIRDEAHRFAVTYHRTTRKKKQLSSELLSIPGVGPSREKLLRMYFGSITRLKSASLEQLLLIKGIGEELARSIYRHYHPDQF